MNTYNELTEFLFKPSNQTNDALSIYAIFFIYAIFSNDLMPMLVLSYLRLLRRIVYNLPIKQLHYSKNEYLRKITKCNHVLRYFFISCDSCWLWSTKRYRKWIIQRFWHKIQRWLLRWMPEWVCFEWIKRNYLFGQWKMEQWTKVLS